MAGIFGDDINSRSDFYVALGKAASKCDAMLAKYPLDPTLQSVKLQLAHVESKTSNRREPPPEERLDLDMGMRMFREFETTDDDALRELRSLVSGVQYYFECWPSDDVASDPDNAERDEVLEWDDYRDSNESE